MNENEAIPTSETSTPPSTGKYRVTASEIINKYQNSTIEDIMDAPPSVISAEIVLLSAKLHEAGSLQLKAEQDYMRKWVETRSTCDTDGQADKITKTTEEYRQLKIANTNEKIVIEMIRSLKKLLASKADEARGIM